MIAKRCFRARAARRARRPAHHGVGGKLVVRRHVDGAQLSPGEERLEGGDDQPVLVHRDGFQLGPGQLEGAPDEGVSQLLDGHHVPRREERLRDQIDRLLAPARHHQVVLGGGEAPGMGQHRGEALPQERVSARVRVPEQLAPMTGDGAPESPRERLGREQPHVGDGTDERQRTSRVRRGHRHGRNGRGHRERRPAGAQGDAARPRERRIRPRRRTSLHRSGPRRAPGR